MQRDEILAIPGLRHPARTEACMDWAEMVSGAILILFMWGHMFMVASVNLGSGVMNALAKFLEDHYLVQAAGPLIVLIFFFHAFMAARKVPFRSREQAVIWKHSARLNHLDTWLWLVQLATAMVLLVLGSVHMWTVLTNLPITAGKSAARVQGGWWLALYLALLPMVEFHVAVGFYRIGVKWGWIKRDNRYFFKGFESKLMFFFIVLGAVSLFTLYFIIEAKR